MRNVDVKPYLRSLLKHKDADGYTPFMYAVRNRAYPAAFAIYDCESWINGLLSALTAVFLHLLLHI